MALPGDAEQGDSFNSKLVRLKVRFRRQRYHIVYRFQFQTGAIKSGSSQMRDCRRSCFNSKLVRLKVKCPRPRCPVKPRFNSKLVRLKVPRRIRWPCVLKRFNSKLVRLKGAGDGVSGCQIEVFQFQTGAIKRIDIFFSIWYPFIVSIPNWCD